MSEVPVVVVEPVTFGCTVQDVLRLLPHVSLGVPLNTAVLGDAVVGETVLNADPYASPMVRRLSEADVEAFIVSVATRVTSRTYRLARLPEDTQRALSVMARDLVATGAAHYVQAAVHPASTDPNNGNAYADRLWQRFQTDLDELRGQIDEELEAPATGLPGRATGSFPLPLFPDDVAF